MVNRAAAGYFRAADAVPLACGGNSAPPRRL